MTITVYIDWENKRVLSPKEFKELMDKASDELFEDQVIFNEYLEENFTRSELFCMTKKERRSIQEDFRDYCNESAEDYLRNCENIDFEKVDIILD